MTDDTRELRPDEPQPEEDEFEPEPEPVPDVQDDPVEE